MLLKRSTLIIIALFVFSGLYAQKGMIRGSVADSVSGEPVSFATIALIKSQESNSLTGAISDEAGIFSIENIPNGNYRVMVSFLGYESRVIEGISVSPGNQETDLGEIKLRPANIQMEAVEVTGVAKTASQKIDRQTYRAVDFETARGGNAIDILSKLPAVSVDPDGEVTVRGTGDFLVYLNGKPTLLGSSEILAQIPAGNIESIDIITIPSSRYDSQGKGGIINITTKHSLEDGFSVSVSGMAGGTPWTNDVDPYSGDKLDNNRYNGGTSLIYNKGRLSLSGSFNILSRNNKGIGDIDPFIYQDPSLGSESSYPYKYFILEGYGSRPKWEKNIMASGGISYNISDRSRISALVQHSQRESGRTAHYKYKTFFSDSQTGSAINTPAYLYNPNDINRTGSFTNFSLDYSIDLDGNGKLKSSLLYENSNLDQEITNKEYTFDPSFGSSDYESAIPDFHSFQIDETPLEAYRFELSYGKEFDNGNSLEIGIQPQWVSLTGIYRYDSIRADGTPGGFNHFNNSIDLSRDVYSGYADFSGKTGKLSYILGLRAEYLNQEMNVESTEYFDEVYDFFGTGRDYDETRFIQKKFDLFPSLHLRYDADETNIMMISASRRINRPPAKDMSPFLYRRHQEIFELGDPLLAPEYVLNAELSYQRNLGTNNLVITGFYRGVQNAIYRVNRLSYSYDANPGGVLLRSITNSGDQLAIGGELGINLSLLKKVKVYLGGSLYNFSVEAEERLFGEQSSSSSTNWSFKGNLNWTIARGFKFTFDYSMISATVTPQGEDYAFNMANAALNYSPPQWKSWNFTARLIDVFGTNQAGGFTTAYSNGIQMFKRAWIYDYEGRIVELGLSYTINMNGKSALKKEMIGKDYF